MSAYEKCWADSRVTGAGTYMDLLRERDASGHVCTAEQQAGPGATKCHICGRMTRHQHTREPMCGCPRDTAGHVVPRVSSAQPQSENQP